MNQASWRRIEDLLSQALELSPSLREEFLKEATRGEDELRAEVESLLDEADTKGFLEKSALEIAGGLLARSRTELTGSALGDYDIDSFLGAGGNAVVYRAHHRKHKFERALKILPEEIGADSTRMRRFLREAKAAQRLDHPNIARVYEVDTQDDVYFIVMEYVKGETLAEKLDSQSLPPVSELLRIATQMANGLRHAHSNRVIHRDIKPSNIIIEPQGRLKILDFGLAKIKLDENDPDRSLGLDTLSRSGVIMGTVSFMSPEQLLGHRDLDRRTDIYSLGVVLYNIATGQLPFSGRTVPDQMDRILNARPEAIARFNQSLPEELEMIIAKCMQKDRKARYRSCKRLLSDLSRVNTR